MGRLLDVAREAIARCRTLASYTEESGFTTRTFLSAPMRAVHADLRGWMERAGMTVRVDAAGNLRARSGGGGSRLVIGSHLDTVPRAGAFDGVLGVVLGVALAENARRTPLEVIGFSEEEGVRFGIPFIGSRAFIGDMDDALLVRRDSNRVSVSDAIRAFGLEPASIANVRLNEPALGYLEFHIEQGPVLESLNLPLGVVETIAGQSRLDVRFDGQANHAGTTPMHLRRDALAGAAEWIGAVEREAAGRLGLVATVGRIEALPGAGNVIAGSIAASLDVRHADDRVRQRTVEGLLLCARQIALRRGLTVSAEPRLDQAAVTMDVGLSNTLARAVEHAGYPVHRMNSGAGHDAMIVARRLPSAMLFLRSPGGISHHPDETVLIEDVAAALDVGVRFIDELGPARG